MTDRERYKRTFSQLHASEEILLEVKTMKNIKIMPVRRLVAVAAAALLIAAMATVAYAADVGGIQTTIQILLKDGTLLNVTDIREIVLEDGTVVKSAFFETADMEPKDDVEIEVNYNGERQVVHGTVVSMEPGEVDAESMESLEVFPVEYRDDGTVWVHYNNRDIEITDLFEGGVCSLELENEQIEVEDGEVTKSTYLTIQYGEGEGYASVGEFVSRIGGDYGSTWVVTDDGTAADGDEVENP